MASVPTLTPAGLAPRRSVLRAFAVPRNDSFTVMPGGLTRVAPGLDATRISNQAGAISKDTWVLASEPEGLTGFWLDSGPTVDRIDPMASIPSRTAENLWWLGRYAERAEAMTRLLRVVYERRSDFQGSANLAGVESLRALLGALTATTATYPGFIGEGAQERLESPGRELLDLVVDDARPGTLAHSVRALLGAAYAVRDQLSGDTWLVVGALDREIDELHDPGNDPQAVVSGTLQRVMQSLLALGGLVNESMVRDIGWRFLHAGARLERSAQLLSLLHELVTVSRSTATDSLVLESVLTAAESIMTYRRRYRSHAQLETVLDLLLLDEGNPRSLAFGLAGLTDDLGGLPAGSDRRLRDEQRLLLEASTALRLADTVTLAEQDELGRRPELEAFLLALREKLLAAADAVERSHFDHLAPRWSLVGPAGARGSGTGGR
jgi:uncharacterized alpha-E superfamily protein